MPSKAATSSKVPSHHMSHCYSVTLSCVLQCQIAPEGTEIQRTHQTAYFTSVDARQSTCMLQRKRLMQVTGVSRLAGRSFRSLLSVPFCSSLLLDDSSRSVGSDLCSCSCAWLCGEYRFCSLLKYLCSAYVMQSTLPISGCRPVSRSAQV